MSLSYDYYPAVLYAIDLISKGNSITRACDDSNISISTFNNYVKANDDLKEQFYEAQQRGYDAMAEALLDPDNHAIYGHSDAKMAKVQSDNIKWFLSKKKSKEYGDKVQVEVNITADKAITDALAQGRQRAALAHSAPVPVIIDVTPELSEEKELAALLR